MRVKPDSAAQLPSSKASHVTLAGTARTHRSDVGLPDAVTATVRPFNLVLFEHEPEAARHYLDAGVRHVLVDAEDLGKRARQSEFDTEIKPVSLRKIGPLTRINGLVVYCRVNPWNPSSHEEIEVAVGEGASRIFLPMVSSVLEVQEFIETLSGRCEAALLIETQTAVDLAGEINALGIDAIYVGLNDLAISREARFIFSAVTDGTVAAVRRAFPDVDFGFAGATVMGRGSPIPCRMLLTEMATLRCGYCFLRRSFRRDIVGRDARREIRRIQDYWRMLNSREAARVESDHVLLTRRIARYEV